MIRRISCILLGLLLLTSAVSAQDSSTPTPSPQYYTVVQGDTLSSIAQRYNTTTLALMRANSIVNPDRVFVGTLLLIPTSEAAGNTEVTPMLSPTPTAAEVSLTPASADTEQMATPAETPLPVTATALPSIGFEIGGEIFGFDHLDALHQAEMNWAKISIHWNTGDPPASARNAIKQAHASHLKVLLEISGDAQEFHADTAAYTQQFAAFLGQVSAFAPDAIEVWNGMNADSISAADYGQLLNAAFFAIKKANLQVLVISGALQKTTTLGGQCTSSGCGDIPYLNALAEAGIGNAADCVGMRYTLGTVSPDDLSGDPRGDEFGFYYPTLVSTYASIFPTKQLCFTEFGYLVTGQVPLANRFPWAQNTTPELRAEWLARAATLANNSGRIRLMIVYNMDATSSSDDIPAVNYAIVSSTGDCSACIALDAALHG
ncbi:MAG: LysM peptidoglycan-binding domain-containing protein [Chloroflexi bacterium]|nr:LysM peptidoglycan-binding domain-containing protein [Chloroflexota bacterium]